MELVVSYDVATNDAAGRRRLRRVARICEGFGQRVQDSVFECLVDATQYVLLIHRLQEAIDPEHDSLRIYRLLEPRDRHVHELGRPLAFDQREPLVF